VESLSYHRKHRRYI